MRMDVWMRLSTLGMDWEAGNFLRCAICSCSWASDEPVARSGGQTCSRRWWRWCVSQRKPTSWGSWCRSRHTETKLRSNHWTFFQDFLQLYLISKTFFSKMLHLWFLVGCVCFRVAENEADVFGKLHRVFVIPCHQRFWHRTQIHGSVDDVPIVLNKNTVDLLQCYHFFQIHLQTHQMFSNIGGLLYRILEEIHWLSEWLRIRRVYHSTQQLSTLTSPCSHIQSHSTFVWIRVGPLAERKWYYLRLKPVQRISRMWSSEINCCDGPDSFYFSPDVL